MSTRHIFNNPDGLVLKSLRGAVALNPTLRLHATSKTVYTGVRNPQMRVAVISGGGAGHEPAHASYTGLGMLSASVCGEIFASPSASQVLTAIRLGTIRQTSAGTDGDISRADTKHRPVEDPLDPLDALLIVNNYTGDRLNFGLAAERARSIGIRLATVVVADDVSLLSRPTLVGPRGLAGNIIVCKILGAAAARGLELGKLKKLGDAVVGSLRSVGASLEHCHVPGRTKADLQKKMIKETEYELGMGLHNELGVRRMSLEGGEMMVNQMLELLVNTPAAETDKDTAKLSGCATVLFVNNLGGMSQLEMCAIVDEIVSQLAKVNIHPSRIYSSLFMTSLNAPGFSVSVLNLTSIHQQLAGSHGTSHMTENVVTDVLSYLDDATDAVAWSYSLVPWPSIGSQRRDLRSEESEVDTLVRSLEVPSQALGSNKNTKGVAYDPNLATKAIRSACSSVLAVEQDLTQFDTVLGDGDCGETFARGARALLQALDDARLEFNGRRSSVLCADIATILEESMGGTSGALFGIFFTALSNALTNSQAIPMIEDLGPPNETVGIERAWKTAVMDAVEALAVYTPARPGDRTVIDALHPFCLAISQGKTLSRAAMEARTGAKATQGMLPKLGRATYVVVDDVQVGKTGEGLPPDPGAWGVAAILEGLAIASE